MPNNPFFRGLLGVTQCPAETATSLGILLAVGYQRRLSGVARGSDKDRRVSAERISGKTEENLGPMTGETSTPGACFHRSLEEAIRDYQMNHLDASASQLGAPNPCSAFSFPPRLTGKVWSPSAGGRQEVVSLRPPDAAYPLDMPLTSRKARAL